jgi:hypothetical protein
VVESRPTLESVENEIDGVEGEGIFGGGQRAAPKRGTSIIVTCKQFKSDLTSPFKLLSHCGFTSL